MVTVPDDLTIHLNEEEANDIGEDLNQAVIENDIRPKRQSDDSAKENPKCPLHIIVLKGVSVNLAVKSQAIDYMEMRMI